MNNKNNKNPKAAAEKKSSWLQHCLACDGVVFTLVFTVFSAVLCYPLLLHPTGHLHSIPLADKGTNLWNLWWVYYALFERHVSPLWCDLVFYPWGGDLRFHTLSVVNGVLASPVTAVFGPVVSYNVLFFVWTIFTGVFAALWGRMFGLSRMTAVALGFIAAFHPFRWNHVEHLNLFSTAWMMASFYCCERWMQSKSIQNFSLFLLVWGLALFSDWYFGLFVGIYYGLRLLVELIHNKDNFHSPQICYAFLLPLIILVGLVFFYFQPPVQNPPYPVSPDEVGIMYSSFWSLSLIHFVIPLWIFPWMASFSKKGAEFALHPGYAQMIMGILGLCFWKKLAITKSSKLFLLLMMVTFALISLGPLLQIHSSVQTLLGYPVPMPAVVFEIIPGLTSMRVFTRFAFVAWLGVSLVALIYFQQTVFLKVKVSSQLIILGGLSVLFLVETQWKPLSVVDYDPPSSIVSQSKGNILELPIEPTRFSGIHLYHQTIHHQPIYVIEISRISAYRKAYLEHHPFVQELSDFVNERNLTAERITSIGDRFCEEISALHPERIVVTHPEMSESWMQRRQQEIDELMKSCENFENNPENEQ